MIRAIYEVRAAKSNRSKKNSVMQTDLNMYNIIDVISASIMLIPLDLSMIIITATPIIARMPSVNVSKSDR